MSGNLPTKRIPQPTIVTEKPVFADMMDAEREKLREMREKDETMLTEFIEFLREKKVEVVDSI